MHITSQMEQFSRAYVSAIAAQAGCNSARPEVDEDSIDVILSMKDIPNSILKRAQIEIQLKSTKNLSVQNGKISYALPIKNYDDLRASVLVPRFLVLVHISPSLEDWIWQTQDFLCLQHCAYWYSLNGFPETENKETITVHVPCGNIFSSEFLKKTMTEIANGK